MAEILQKKNVILDTLLDARDTVVYQCCAPGYDVAPGYCGAHGYDVAPGYDVIPAALLMSPGSTACYVGWFNLSCVI